MSARPSPRIRCAPPRERGAIAIIVGLSLAVLVGFAGLALDLGRLYVNKNELQSAADACALAAAAELVCDTGVAGTCPGTYLQNAEAAGIFVAGRNSKDFQGAGVSIGAGDVRFSTVFAPNSNYLSRTSGADPNSKFVMCTARNDGIQPWFMGVLGFAASDVAASAVATLAKSQSFCNAAPIGICKKSGGAAPHFGYAVGEWIASTFQSNGNAEEISGGFKWVDFSPQAGGNSEIRDQLAGSGAVCGIGPSDNVGQPGQQQGAKSAYNTRFGIYPNGANAYTPTSAPPDRTGYAYPNQAPGSPVIGIGTSAYDDYRTRQGSNDPFIGNEYGVSGPGGNIPGTPVAGGTEGPHGKGSERRLVAVPVIECGTGETPILGMTCVLMLNPMSNGASGTIYLEYRGSATEGSSPCRSSGTPSGPGGAGPLVPALVQ